MFDLVDEMMWEDVTEFLTLEEAGLEDHAVKDTVPAAQSFYYADEGGSEIHQRFLICQGLFSGTVLATARTVPGFCRYKSRTQAKKKAFKIKDLGAKNLPA